METSKKNNIIIIIILCAIGVTGFFYGFGALKKDSVKTEYMDVPEIITSIISFEDGKNHRVKLKLAFVIEDTGEPLTFSEKSLKNELYKIVSNMDYNKLSNPDGFDYIRENIRENININKDIIIDIYITKLQFDYAIDG